MKNTRGANNVNVSLYHPVSINIKREATRMTAADTLLWQALRQEQNLAQRYQGWARGTTNSRARQLFLEMAEAHTGHVNKIRQQLTSGFSP
ncbi:MAG: hypothetical protein D9V47_03785 [Clostridia bacterium]|nr:MAG: hypothetical protein D9V47_03785 [Clostridia bacterium]